MRLKIEKRVARGWCQGRSTAEIDGVICYCAGGAVEWATSDTGYNSAMEAMKRVVKSSVVRWNDAPGRTQAEVVDAFTRAIELARKESKE